MQIPDDLSPPDESDAIRLPSDAVAVSSTTAGECLETPPPFFGDSRPFVNDGEVEPRQSRREARRQARADAPEQPEAAPAQPSDPAPAGDDRVIDN